MGTGGGAEGASIFGEHVSIEWDKAWLADYGCTGIQLVMEMERYFGMRIRIRD